MNEVQPPELAQYRALFDIFPHCDDLVLHAPGQCVYCDDCPAAQAWRVAHRVNFTGQSVEGFAPCFAERRRSIDTIHRWGGNRPK